MLLLLSYFSIIFPSFHKPVNLIDFQGRRKISVPIQIVRSDVEDPDQHCHTDKVEDQETTDESDPGVKKAIPFKDCKTNNKADYISIKDDNDSGHPTSDNDDLTKGSESSEDASKEIPGNNSGPETARVLVDGFQTDFNEKDTSVKESLNNDGIVFDENHTESEDDELAVKGGIFCNQDYEAIK